MTPKEKKDFVKRMKEAKEEKAKEGNKKKGSKKKSLDYQKGYLIGQVGGVKEKNMKAWLIQAIKTREKNPKNYSSDYSRGELRGYKEALAQLTGKRTRFGR